MNLHPFNVVLANAQDTIRRGGTIFQQFICSHCKAKQTMADPNKFFTEGICEECGQVTDIQKDGCNFLAMFGK